jgi:serine/threonine protein phosphatase PrpC
MKPFYLGWRNYMEDAHISVSPLSDKKSSLFAVFDGHGGKKLDKLRSRSCYFRITSFRSGA